MATIEHVPKHRYLVNYKAIAGANKEIDVVGERHIVVSDSALSGEELGQALMSDIEEKSVKPVHSIVLYWVGEDVRAKPPAPAL